MASFAGTGTGEGEANQKDPPSTSLSNNGRSQSDVTRSSPPSPGERSPTLSFTLEGKTASEVCQQLASRHIYAWDGHFYAIRVCEVLGLMEIGGVTRMGISAYTNEEDIKRTLATLEELL